MRGPGSNGDEFIGQWRKAFGQNDPNPVMLEQAFQRGDFALGVVKMSDWCADMLHEEGA